MNTVFMSGPDTIRVSIEPNPDPDGEKPRFSFQLFRNNVPCATFTKEELHSVLDNARDVLLVVADGAGSNYAGEFRGKVKA